jgi:hypothetical protein
MYYDTNKATMMNKCTSASSCFDGHGGALEQYRRHHLMRHVQGSSVSHWMLPSGDYLLHIAPAAARATGKQTTINKYTFKVKAGRFDGHGNVLVRNCMHHLMGKVQSFTKSHWTLPSGKHYVQNIKGTWLRQFF